MVFLKYLFVSAALFISFIFCNEVEATNLMGADIAYECLNACTVRVHLRAYRDCREIDGLDLQGFAFVGNGAGCQLPNPVGDWVPGDSGDDWMVSEVTPVCPSEASACQDSNSPFPGMEEYSRFRDYNICGLNCTTYNLEWWGMNRTGGLSSGSANQSIGLNSTTLNTAITPCNSSPQFTQAPSPFICQGQHFTFNQSATDLDGDSLSYALGTCIDSSGASVAYNAGFSPTEPLGSQWGVTIDPLNGDIHFTPTPGGLETGVMCVYVSEWRNGTLINTVVRDIQLNVISCVGNSNPSVTGVTSIQNGIGQGNSTTGIFGETCVGNNYCLDIPITDPDMGDIVSVWWDQSISGATFTESGNPTATDTIVGTNPTVTFCFTPSTEGIYSFLVEIRDNACPFNGANQFTVTIDVYRPSVSTYVVPSCGVTEFCARDAQGIPPFSFQWVGNGGFSASDSCTLYNYPSAGTFFYSLAITDAIGCTAQHDDWISVPEPSPLPSLVLDDLTACTYLEDSIGVPPILNGEYSWSPSTGLSDTTVSRPEIIINNPGPTPFIQEYAFFLRDTVTGCEMQDTALVIVSYPAELSFDSTNISCFNGNDGTIDLNILAGLPPYQIDWSGPGGFTSSASNLSNLIAGTYTVTVTDAGGCESTDSVQLEEPTPPVVTDSIEHIICTSIDGAIDIEVSGATPPYTYSWSNGETTQDIDSLAAGSYTVTIEDANGCIHTESFVVTSPPPLTVDFTIYDVSCPGETNGIVVAEASGGHGAYGYYWVDLDTLTDSISNLAPGSYQLEVTDTFFGPVQEICTSYFTAVVSEPNPLALDFDVTPSPCAGEDAGIITAQPSGGNGNYGYTWSHGPTTQTISGLDSGTYEVTVTDTHYTPAGAPLGYLLCSVSDSVQLTDPLPLTLSISSTPASCSQESDGTMTVNVSGGTSPYSYTWSTNPVQTTASVTGLPAGTYTVTVTDANACTDSATASIAEPSPVQAPT